ncbi:MAG: hypothetical protein AAF092_09225 [Pseudomonadota bacterium]
MGPVAQRGGVGVGVLIGAALAVVAIVILGRIVQCYLSNPAAALKLTTHDPALFPQVMAGRYFFFILMLGGAALSGNLWWLAYVFAGLAFVGIFDAVIYQRAGKSARKHAQAGAGCVAAAAICVTLAAMGPV